MKSNGEPFRRHWREPTTRNRRLVLLLDVSGSMEPYARALLRFVHAAVAGRQKVEAFSLGTRLTRITRELSSRDPDIALRQTSTRVVDWSGGTRLGEGLRQFNDAWGQRGMARGAIVVILSDGWDRGDPAVLAEQMVRLHRVAHRVIWVNPLKVTPGYAPLARGMAAALPYVDAFVEGHSVAALEELARAISSDRLGQLRVPGARADRDPYRHGTLDTPMRRAVSVRRSHVAVVDGDTRLTYGELDRRIAGARAGLRELGLVSGDRVGGLALNSFRHLEASMGVPTSNLVLNDLNFRLALPELEFIVNDSGARVLLADERHWETAVALLANCDCLEQLVWLSDGPAPDGEATWDDLCAAAPVDPPADLDADCVAGITYTGGTTGLPKGVHADARQPDGRTPST